MFFMLQVWTGNGPQQWFMINIMKATGTRLDPVLCTLLVSVTNVIGQAMAVVASLRWDRRPVFISTTAVYALAWLGLAMTLQLSGQQVDIFTETTPNTTTVNDDTSYTVHDFLPPLLFIVLRFCFQLSMGPYPWIYGNELYPLDLRSYLCGFSSSFEPIQVSIYIKIHLLISTL